MEIFHVVSLLVTAVVAGGLAALVATAARHGHATLLREGDLALLEDATLGPARATLTAASDDEVG